MLKILVIVLYFMYQYLLTNSPIVGHLDCFQFFYSEQYCNEQSYFRYFQAIYITRSEFLSEIVSQEQHVIIYFSRKSFKLYTLLLQNNYVCILTQSCLTFCDPMDCSPPVISGHRIFQARILDQVIISSSRGSS